MTIPLFSENGKGENQIFLEFFSFFRRLGTVTVFPLFLRIIPGKNRKIREISPRSAFLPGCGGGQNMVIIRTSHCREAISLPRSGTAGVSTMLGKFVPCRTIHHSIKHAGDICGGRMISSPTAAGQVHDAVPCNGMRKSPASAGRWFFNVNFPKQTVAFLREIRYNNRNMKGGVAPVSFSIRRGVRL